MKAIYQKELFLGFILSVIVFLEFLLKLSKKDKNTLKTFLSNIFFLLVLGTNAQSLNLSFNHLTREGGLSNNNPVSLLSDSKGFLWIGTHNGLNRFDGSSCQTFKKYNSNISGVSITNIIEDKNSNLWFTTEMRLNRYNRSKNRFETIEFIKDGKHHHYNLFYVDNQNRIWLTVSEKGVFVYNQTTKTAQQITKEYLGNIKINSKPFQEVKQIFFSGNQSGLNILNLKNDKVINSTAFFDGKKQPSLNFARYFFIENDSLVWLTGNALGLIKFNYKTENFKYFDTFQNKKINVLTSVAFRPHSSQLYVGSTDLGILVFDTKQEKFVNQMSHNSTNPKSLKANWIEDIVIDKNQNLFASLMGWGVDFTNLNTSTTQHWFSKEEALSYKLNDNVIAYSFIHKNKILLKFQQGGILILDKNGKFLERVKEYDMAENMVYGVDSTLYACGMGEILILDDDFKARKRIPIINKDGSLEHTNFIAVISENELLVGTMMGFYSVKKEASKYVINSIEELQKYNFLVNMPLYFDKATQQLFFSNNWWNGFNILTKKNDTWQVKALKKLEVSVYNIVPDATDKQKIWLCTNKGLWKFDTKTYQYEIWDEAKGLPDNSVTTYIPAVNGDFWLITNRGISFYNKKLNQFKNFSEKDGATSSEYDWYGNFKLPDGKMMFAGTDGITVIDPKQMNSNSVTKLYFTDIKVNEKSLQTETYIGENSSIRLKPNQSSFSIDFVGIDYANPDNIKLQYQLQNFDNEWITTKNPANVHFSNIPDGSYNLKIRSLTEDGKVAAEKSLEIMVDAPFWRTSWFRLFVLLIVFGIIYAFYRYRINQLLEMQAVRNRISTDLHDEIGATLSGIGILSTIAQQQVSDQNPAHTLLGRITEDALTIGNSIDDIVWSINPKNDDLANIIARMNRQAAELLDAKNIDYKIVVPEKIDDIKLSMEQRRDVYLIFKEAMNNLIKYANCTSVDIEIKLENRRFTLLIKDDGKGFEVEKPSLRNGMKNMKNRAKNLKGKLKISSELDKGTSVFLEFMM